MSAAPTQKGGGQQVASKKQDRVLKASIHVQKSDGSIVSALGGSTEADARDLLGDGVVNLWDDHVWADPDAAVGGVNVAPSHG